MIKSFFMGFLAIFFPWLALLIEDNPGGALVALILQASVIGWLPATVWAWRTVRETRKLELAEKRKIKQAAKEARKRAKAEAQEEATAEEVQTEIKKGTE
ncbi:hypothetical protein B6N58_00675 [Legionella micdadei]|nr:YqaE/Pmp3 family membrane protein [Legionella micdadei]ARG96318.1 hypothetical protein B6N58_00675 [Legionella micdadei]ARG99073.1 hypothetical protein B6V88_00675 [Legionella micdadei]